MTAMAAANGNEPVARFAITRTKNVRVEVNGAKLADLHDDLADLVRGLQGEDAAKAERIRASLAVMML